MKPLHILLILLIPFVGIGQTIYVTNPDNSGPGTLREAIANSIDGTTIRFSESLIGETIILDSSIDSDNEIRIVGIISEDNPTTLLLNSYFFANNAIVIDSIEFNSASTGGGSYNYFFKISDDLEMNYCVFNDLNVQDSWTFISEDVYYSDYTVSINNCDFSISEFSNDTQMRFYDVSGKSDLSIINSNLENCPFKFDYLPSDNSLFIENSILFNCNIDGYGFEYFAIFNSNIISSDITNCSLNINYIPEEWNIESLSVFIDLSNFDNSDCDFSHGNFPENTIITNSSFNNTYINSGYGYIDNCDFINENLEANNTTFINGTDISNSSFNSSVYYNYVDEYDQSTSNLTNNTFARLSISGGSTGDDPIHSIIIDSCVFEEFDSSFLLELTINNSIFANYQSSNFGHRFHAINTTINSSLFHDNSIALQFSGQFEKDIEINNSTFYNNDIAIDYSNNNNLTINASSFKDNEYALDLTQFYADDVEVEIYNSVVGDIDFGFSPNSITSLGYNIFSQDPSGIVNNDVSNVDSDIFEDLSYNGGFTKTLLPVECGPAHDSGDPNFEGISQNDVLTVGNKDVGASEREDECDAVIEVTFDCVTDGICMELMDGTGEFSSLNDCQQACQNVSSISENDFNINIYPNPSSNVFNLELYSEKEIEIRVNNILGEQVYMESNKSIGEFNTQIDLSDYSKGIYNLTLTTSNGISYHKLILQ